MEWKAPGDKIVVKVPPPSRKTESGLYLTDKSSVGTLGKGTVIAAGPDAHNVKVGDEVYFDMKGSVEILKGSEDVASIRSMHIDYAFAIIRTD